jgi:hypothetical protein
MWTIEAFRTDNEELEWDVDLFGVERAALEEELGLGDLTVPGAYPLTPEQARLALSSFADSDVDDLMSRGLGAGILPDRVRR